MSTFRDHMRAKQAFDHVSKVETENARKYGAMVHKLPILVHSAGLAAALHFVASRSDPRQREILHHLAVQLRSAGLLTVDGGEALLAATRSADFELTQQLTRETQRVLLWYKRFVQSLLRVEPTEEIE